MSIFCCLLIKSHIHCLRIGSDLGIDQPSNSCKENTSSIGKTEKKNAPPLNILRSCHKKFIIYLYNEIAKPVL